MKDEEKVLRRLVIKTYHIDEVKLGSNVSIQNNSLQISTIIFDKKLTNFSQIEKIEIEIISPKEHKRWTNSIMDIIPISTKVLGRLGEGITHTLTGVYVVMTGVDTAGVQVAEFGSSEGILEEQLCLNRAGTPADEDFIILLNVTLKEGQGANREAILKAHQACDLFIQEIREKLKKADGRSYTEKHEFFDKIRFNKKRVAIVKQVAGQGAMYDNQILPQEPSGFTGGRSIIDMGNVPIVLTPNEYRDGALRAMT
jgi:proline reductase cluster protein PrdD